jgi:hypothetical protein
MYSVVEKIRPFIYLIFAVIVLYLFGLLIQTIFQNYRMTSTPDNIARIKSIQRSVLEMRWIGITQGKKGLAQAFEGVPKEQQLLINANVQGARLLGYLGPHGAGVFDEDTGVRLALASGARCLIIEIDRMVDSYEPILMYRDGWGVKRSLNIGSINSVAKSISGRAFAPSNDGTPSYLASDPLFVVLYFVSAPSPSDVPREYVRFMAKVARAVQPLGPYLMGQTPQGDFRRQNMESELFYLDYKLFSNHIILLTNADTSAFRRLDSLGLGGEISKEDDLDLLVHSRLYSRESPSGLGITASPSGSQQPAAVITSTGYWLNTPPDRLADAATQTKKSWTIAMPPVSTDTNVVASDKLKTLMTTYGVQSIPVSIFTNEDSLKGIVLGKDAPFTPNAWVAKPLLIRYIPPPLIAIAKPIAQTNAGGGAMRSPE